MEAILRFGLLNDEEIAALRSAGLELIQALQDRSARSFNVLVSEAEQFADRVSEAEAFLRANEKVLSGIRVGTTELDFGTCLIPEVFMKNHLFPSPFLGLLARLGIDLNLSIYE